MKMKSINYIKIETNPIFDHNSLNNQYITYNKPLFINMFKETSNNYKTSTLSTKINTINVESPFYESNKIQKNINNISVKEFILDKNHSKTADNFFNNCLNSLFNSNKGDKDINTNSTFTPGKDELLLQEKEEQFTPYLGQKNICLDNICINNEENLNFSNKFNNSKEIITSSSLNLKHHLNEKLSNNSKTINKYQKLSFYQKHINNRSKTNNIHTKRLIYNKKSIILKRSIDKGNNNTNQVTKNVILIQAIFRGYIYRINLYSKLKNFTYITIFCQTMNNILLRRKEYIFRGWIYLLKKRKINRQKLLVQSNRISLYINGNGEKIKKLIEHNNKLKIKISEFLINNNKLKIDINILKEFEMKYYNLLMQYNQLKNANNNLLKENDELFKEINALKSNIEINSKLNCISPQVSIYFNNNNKNLKSSNKNKEFEICKNLNDFSILNKNNKLSIEKNDKDKDISITDENKYYGIQNLSKKNENNKNYRLIIVKTIRFIIKKDQKKENESNDIK